jgi:hypothetical protein
VGVGAAILLAALLLQRIIATGVTRARTGIADVTQGLSVEADSHQTVAGLARFRARREAVTAMRADLRRLVAAESAFIADSGHPTTKFYPPYFEPTRTKGQAGMNPMERLWLPGPGWAATLHDVYNGITCWVYVGPDTTISHSPSGVPACAASSAVPPAMSNQ